MTATSSALPAIEIGLGSIGRLMPMSLWVCPDGMIRGTGPTLAKLVNRHNLVGARFFDLFALQRPRSIEIPSRLADCEGQRIKLGLRHPPHTGFKGQCVMLTGNLGVLINLSFGISVADAVREHHLTDSDFAPTDLTIEMLYLIEAKSAVMEELRRLNLRLQEARVAAENQALTDALTGLRNRRALDLTLKGAKRDRMAFGLLHVDLDHFKQVNDTLGHAAGDHVLEQVARVLREETRVGDTVARVGGDEFMLILPGLTDGEALVGISERILQRIKAPIMFEGQPCRISASIGAATSAHYPAVKPDRIINDADRALYVSKNDGRGRITLYVPTIANVPPCHCRGPVTLPTADDASGTQE